jgi:RNA polymerase sigma-70 factor, ECF subfamily
MAIRCVQDDSSTPISDLVQRARLGDSSAFDAVVHELGDRLWRSALAMCRHEASARDLVQQTWLEAWKSLKRFDGRCLFSTWLHGILRHRYLKLVRHNTRKPIVLLPDPGGEQDADPGQPHPGDDLQRREDRAAIDAILDALPVEQQQVLRLRFFADAALADIAAALGCPEGTVKSRLHHGLRKLRRNPECLNLLASGGESRARQ